MTTSDRSWGWHFGIASWLAMGGAIAISGDCAHAQIAPDSSLGTESLVLFHSFEQFSIRTGSMVYFDDASRAVDFNKLFRQSCPPGGEFFITGRGGLPPNPEEALRSDLPLVDLGTPIQGQENPASAAPSTNPTSSPPPTQIVEAQGWVINNYGEVVLTATAPTVTPHIPWMTPVSCHTPETSS